MKTNKFYVIGLWCVMFIALVLWQVGGCSPPQSTEEGVVEQQTEATTPSEKVVSDDIELTGDSGVSEPIADEPGTADISSPDQDVADVAVDRDAPDVAPSDQQPAEIAPEAPAVDQGTEPSIPDRDPLPEQSPVEHSVEPSTPDTATPPENLPEIVSEQIPEITPESPVVETSPESSGSGNIGDPCTQDSDCGVNQFCMKESERMMFPFPNSTGFGPPKGYCSQNCGMAQNCPSGSECYSLGAAAGICLKTCKNNADCRQSDGYNCENEPKSQKDLCFPPGCTHSQPSGKFTLIVIGSHTSGQCATQPLADGTKLNVEVVLDSGNIKFQFGSKPGSPLPVAWELIGPYKDMSSPITATAPAQCSQNCDGQISGNFDNACVFYGNLEVKDSPTCTHNYNIALVR
jgi:hypothetical protein